MKNIEWKKLVGVVGRMMLAYALVSAQGAWAGQTQGTKDKAGSPQKAAAQQANEKQSAVPAKAQSKQAQSEESESAVAEEKPSRDGSHEGIKVHGHWTIDVRNPDGTVVTHREFENSLTQATGASLLATLLNSGGQALSPGFFWAVTLGGSPGPCAATCELNQPNATTFGSFSSSPNQNSFSLVTSVNGGTFVLGGSVVVSANSSITDVASWSGVPVNGVPLPALRQFTAASSTSTPPSFATINVVAGQTVAVTVNISFS